MVLTLVNQHAFSEQQMGARPCAGCHSRARGNGSGVEEGKVRMTESQGTGNTHQVNKTQGPGEIWPKSMVALLSAQGVNHHGQHRHKFQDQRGKGHLKLLGG